MIHRWRMRRRLADWLDDSLTEREREGLHRHLERCHGCAAEIRLVEEADGLLRGAYPAPAAPQPEVAQRVFRAAVERSGVLRRARRWRALGICSLLTFAAAAGVVRSTGSGTPETLRAALQATPAEIPVPGVRPAAISPTAPERLARVSLPAADAAPPAAPHRRPRSARRAAVRSRRPAAEPATRSAPAPVLSEHLASAEPPAAVPHLLVVVTASPSSPDGEDAENSLSDEGIGYARAWSIEEVAPGEMILKEATVASPGAETRLLLVALPAQPPVEALPGPGPADPEMREMEDDDD
jgi:hypothetical protein